MDRDTLRKVQIAQLDIAKEIKRVCDENNIKYFLDSGTLIGAVRHGGFIPWDDDMDIGMLREEYEKFLKIAPLKLKSNYFLQTWDNDPAYCFPFAKVRKQGTKYVEAISMDSGAHDELFVDVLPYDNFPTNVAEQRKIRRKVYCLMNTLLMKCNMTPWNRHKGLAKKMAVRIKYLPHMIESMFRSKESLKKDFYAVITANQDKETGLLFEQYGAAAGTHPVPSDLVSGYIEMKFEDELFKVPIGYDQMLKAIYGDYMKLPPEGQRENRHQVLELKL